MNMPENDILALILERLAVLEASLADDLAWMEDAPDTLADFETMASHRRTASRAVLKSFEQMEDQLARAFRLLPKLLGKDSSRWFSRDHADFMEQLGITHDAARWARIVKLRKDLVHDYPLKREVQFERFLQAIGFIPVILEAHKQLVLFVKNELPSML